MQQKEIWDVADLQKKLTSALEVTGNKTDDTDEVQVSPEEKKHLCSLRAKKFSNNFIYFVIPAIFLFH